ncbi:Retrovirus-related Pol polyprotein, partial [Mucuna pruriens]
MKHPTEDHSLFGIDLIDGLVEECLQLDNSSEDIPDFAGETDSFDCLGSITEEVKYDELWEVHNLSDSKEDNTIIADFTTRKDHFPLPFIDQVLEKLAGKSHYYFLDGFSGYMQIHIAPEDQYKTTFTCPFSTYACTCMPFGLRNALSTFQHYMTSIFLDLLQDCMEVFMDDFMVYAELKPIQGFKRCIDTNLVLNFEKRHFMVTEGIVLGHLVSNRGIEVDKSKINIITSLPNHASMQEIVLPLSKLLQKDVEFNFDQPYIEAFQELKNRLTSTPIFQAPN